MTEDEYMKHFAKLGIAKPILKALEEHKFETPSEVQEKSIPFILQGKDVIAGSATGSGKTLAFATGIIEFCRKGSGLQALILTPTRELATQIVDALRRFSRYKPLEITLICGGLSINPQIERLRTADVVVATPGRILDHIQRNTINLKNLKILVIDEADRMFDMGFIIDVERIIRQCPMKRQTLLFSATITDEVSRLSRRYMKDPIRVSAGTQVDPTKLTQVYYDVTQDMKFSLLVHLLRNDVSNLSMVFCNTREGADFVEKNLRYNGINAQAIHGGFTQAKRSMTMEHFHSKKFNVLVCTDVAARGLDIKGVSHVYNYDIPRESKNYIHRIGRTARAGKEGKAITLLTREQHPDFAAVMKEGVELVKEQKPEFERVITKGYERTKFSRSQRRPQNRSRSGFGNRGPAKFGMKRRGWKGPSSGKFRR